MGRYKQRQFDENDKNPIVFKPLYHDLIKGFPLKGKWRPDFFKNENPIVLELGCGKGEYTVGLANKYREKNYIGIDLKGARMWRGATDSQQLGLKNVSFIRNKIDQLEHLFKPNEVDEIWLTFSDPQPKKERRRLSSPKFLKLYHQVLKPNAIIHIKTDSRELFDYTMEVINYFKLPLHYHTYDLYHSNYDGDAPQIQTYYEKIYLKEDKPINYAQFSLNDKIPAYESDRLPKNDSDE